MVGCPFETYHRTYHLASDLPSQAAWIERDVQRRLGSIKQKYFDEIVDKIVESIF